MRARSLWTIRMIAVISALSVLLAPSVLANCPAGAEAPTDLAFVPDASLTAIHFQLADSLIYMQATLNGSQPLWMMLDTGSNITVFDESVSKALGLEAYGQGDAYGPGEGAPQKLVFANHARLRFADAELGDQTVATLPLDWFSREVGRNTDGFLGSDLFRKFVVEIDYAGQVLRLYDPAMYSYSGPGQRLPLEFNWDTVPRVRAQVVTPEGKEISGIFLVDTGSATGFWLTKEFNDAHPEIFSMEKTMEVPSVVVVGGRIQSRVGEIPALRLGNFVIQRPAARFSQTTSGLFAMPDLAGIIGAEVLSRFTVIFDYSRREMILQPNARFGHPDAQQGKS